jgi:glycosyltransferase involved in cell wall biosynthesis
MTRPSIAILHYTTPPVVGGVEAVILAQARAFLQAGYPVTLIAGRGKHTALPRTCNLTLIPELDTRHPEIAQMTATLVGGQIPADFSDMVDRISSSLEPMVTGFEHLIIHNIMTKHFNLPLTAAIARLIETGAIRHTLAWCHDFSWTSAGSRHKVHPGYPWDYLRTALDGVSYVTVSQRRRQELASLFGCPVERIHLVYNGVDPARLLGLSSEGMALIERLGLLDSDLILLMPVRVTQAKNIEYALRVLAHLKTSCRNPRLIVTGPPDPHDAGNRQYYQLLLDLRARLELSAEMRFVYESGPEAEEPYIISEGLVGELFRISDVIFMPSHREGFGMPVLEAGLAGVPVVATDIPAAKEIGEQEVLLFSPDLPPQRLAAQISSLVNNNPLSRFRRRLRQDFTWESIFRHSIEPLLRYERMQT